MKLQTQEYHNLDGTDTERAAASVPWYWRALTIASFVMILGGFLMLPITFDTDPKLNLAPISVGIFAAALVVAGFCSTLLICVAVRSLSYRADAVFAPALISCILGFLTVWYSLIMSSRYQWNSAATMTAVISGIGAVVYTTLLGITNRRITQIRRILQGVTSAHEPPQAAPALSRWQSPEYYSNYVKNMFPSASYEPHNVGNEAITEEELQRQQMLMLLLSQDSGSAPDLTSSTFKLEWHGQDQEPNTPLNSSFRQSPYPQSQPASATLQLPGQIRPWDGVWRSISQQSRLSAISESIEESREARRREIEMGA